MKAKATHFLREFLVLPLVLTVLLSLPCCHTIGMDEPMVLLTNQPNTTFSARLTGEHKDQDEGWFPLGVAKERTGDGQYKLLARLKTGRRYDLKAENPRYRTKRVRLTEPIDIFPIPFYSSELKRGAAPPKTPGTVVKQPSTEPRTPSKPYTPPAERWALVVGIGEYKDKEVRAIAHAEEDAIAMKDFLVAKAGYRTDHVYLLTNRTATAWNLKKNLNALAKNVQAEDDLLVYFACHGVAVPDSSSGNEDGLEKYLLPHDIEVNDVEVGAISMKQLEAALDKIECAQVALILDTCFSGGARSVAKGGPGTRNTTVTSSFLAKLGRRSGQKHKKIITACKDNELAQDDPGGGHGVFTLCLLEALKSGEDKDEDGSLTLHEVFRHLDRRVRKRSSEIGKRQHPQWIGETSYPFVIRKIRK
ncbi:MAG: caspase family protein [Planctomycetota bacterium]|jgi:hypothetical protein